MFKPTLRKSLFYLIFSTLSLNVFAQSFIPGNTYFDSTGYVEYIAGNLPIVISVPHGGYLEPDVIPDRDCNGCVYVRDSYTQELGHEMQEAFVEQTGCYPHVVINLLHRKKFDANRDIGDAADGNLTVELAWYNYHEFLDSAKASIAQVYERGLFLDMHGHAHDIQRIELGYTLSKNELQLSDDELDTDIYIDESSIRSLVADNIQSLNHSELLRGEHSFGTLLENAGFPAVPSTQQPFPLDNESYFSGGYNTVRHSSIEGGPIDGVQVECNQDIRFDSDIRQVFADSITQKIVDYIGLHYDNDFAPDFCNQVTHTEDLQSAVNINVFPNPAQSFIHIETDLPELQVAIYSSLGQMVKTDKWDGSGLDVSSLKNGFYILEFISHPFFLKSKILIQR